MTYLKVDPKHEILLWKENGSISDVFNIFRAHGKSIPIKQIIGTAFYVTHFFLKTCKVLANCPQTS